MIIGVDIDGVLTNETEGHDYENRTPNWEMIKRINGLAEKGNKIYLFTSRWPSDKYVTQQWLDEHGVIYHDIAFDKPKFDLYIDDIAVNPLHCFLCKANFFL